MNTPDNRYDDMLEAISDLKSRGYNKSFFIRHDGLYCTETKETFKSDKIFIVEFHRFEGATDFEDMSIIYALETDNGLKGTTIDAFGTYADAELGEFLKHVHFKEK